MVLVTLLAGGAAAAFAYLNRDTYESTSKLLFDQTIGPALSALGLPPVGQDADNLARNNVEVVGSRRVAEATAEDLRGRGIDTSADQVADDVAVTGTKDTDVVEVSAEADSAQGAALLANTYSATAVGLVDEEQRALAREALQEVRRQFEELPRSQRRDALGREISDDIVTLRTLVRAGTGSPRVIQPAYAPRSESGSPVQAILLGLLFGVILGVGLALIREQSDRRLHHSQEVAEAFNAQVITTVPRHRKLKQRVSYAELPQPVAEAFRMLQMNLRFGPGPPVRNVLVTSARSREGKTTVAWNLASAAAAAGMSVSLVEADLRRPVIAARYGLTPTPGLSDVLRGECLIADAIRTVPSLAGDSASNGHLRPMQVIVAGEPPPDPWALLQSPAMIRVLELVSRDLVVIDAPPIPHVGDAIPLLDRVDGVLICASVSSIRSPDAIRLRDQLAALDARVLGVVANGGSAATGYAYGPPPMGAPPRASVDSRQVSSERV